MAELLLFSAARAQLVAERIRPALEAGHVIICDRFYDSTTAYQGAGRGVADLEWLKSLHRRVTAGLVPDRTYLVEVDLETAQSRREEKASGNDRMEAVSRGFYERVAAAYATLADEQPDRIVRLDGEQSIEALHAVVCSDVEQLLGGTGGTPDFGTGSPEP